jgi:adenylate cyclase
MSILFRGSLVQRLRLVSGLVLFAFAVTHFLNHALGLISLHAMEEFQTLRYSVTRSTPGTIVLGGAFLMHLGLALVRVTAIRSWTMSRWEVLQIVTGLCIPLLLVDHVVSTRFASSLYDTNDYYKPVLASLWPNFALRQTFLLLLVWWHACVGLHFWLRLAPWYRKVAPLLLALAVMLPTLALAGFMVGGREVAASLGTPENAKAMFQSFGWPADEQAALLNRIARWGVVLFGMLAAGVGALHISRGLGDRLEKRVPITYSGGATVEGRVGATLLEMSRQSRVPHASVCGGRARCSTCRVRVDKGAETLPPPQFAEAVTLGAIKAPPGVRLACQVRPQLPLTVTRLVTPQSDVRQRVVGAIEDEQGVEKTLAVMFLDVRGFTRLSEKRLPYDVVFLLNRFFAVLGDAIQSEGGWIDKYMGDGLLAVFGRETGAAAGCRSALAAAAKIDLALDKLNKELGAEVGETIKVGVGLHVGPMVVGRIGHPDTATITVIGSTVNAAARLEALTKELEAQLVISKACATLAECNVEHLTAQKVAVRGLTEPIDVYAIKQARALAKPARDVARLVGAV